MCRSPSAPSRRTSPRVSTRATRPASRAPRTRSRKQGAGDQGLMFGYADADTPELMPLPIGLAHRLARKLTAVRRDGTLPYLRPDGKTQVTIAYDDDKPVGVETVVLSTQHAADIDLDNLLTPDIKSKVIQPGARRDRPRLVEHPRPGQPDRPLRHRRPDGRRGPHRPQDHRRHLRRLRPPRRRRLLRQGPVEGRPLRRVRHALGGQERRGRRPGQARRGPDRLRDRQGRARGRVRRDLRDRPTSTRPRSRRPSTRSSTCAPARSCATCSCCARSTSRPRRTATSAATTSTSPGSAPTAPTP